MTGYFCGHSDVAHYQAMAAVTLGRDSLRTGTGGEGAFGLGHYLGHRNAQIRQKWPGFYIPSEFMKLMSRETPPSCA